MLAGVWTGQRIVSSASSVGSDVSLDRSASPSTEPLWAVLALSEHGLERNSPVRIVGALIGSGTSSPAILRGDFVETANDVVGKKIRLRATEVLVPNADAANSQSGREEDRRVAPAALEYVLDAVLTEENSSWWLKGQFLGRDGRAVAQFVLRKEEIDPRVHCSGFWMGEAVPDDSLADFMIPTNPCRWALALIANDPRRTPTGGRPVGAVIGCGYFDDSGDVPGHELLYYVLLGTFDASSGRVSFQKHYETLAETEGFVVDYEGALHDSNLTGTWKNSQGGSFGKFNCRLMNENIHAEIQRTATSLDDIASMLKAGDLKNVSVLTGAGVSVAAGIPDFRSPGGMYDTLRPDLLTATADQRRRMACDPTTVVSWDLFRVNQFPYMEVRRPFILGSVARQWAPTVSHFFVRLLHDRGLLNCVFTQNIDGLDFHTKIPENDIIPVHGSIALVRCEFCDTDADVQQFCADVRRSIKDIYETDPNAPKESSPILCKACGKPGLKPATVLYGRSLPTRYFEAVRDRLPSTDLLIIAGTSLTVGPANQIPELVSDSTVRLVVNREKVGESAGIDYSTHSTRDVFAEGNCDDVFLDLVERLGWLDDLAQYSAEMCPASREKLAARRKSDA